MTATATLTERQRVATEAAGTLLALADYFRECGDHGEGDRLRRLAERLLATAEGD